MLKKLSEKPKVFHLLTTSAFNAILDFKHSIDDADVGFINLITNDKEKKILNSFFDLYSIYS